MENLLFLGVPILKHIRVNAFSKLGGGHWVPGMGNRENTVMVHIHNLIGQWMDG